jgi:hypothetical protein
VPRLAAPRSTCLLLGCPPLRALQLADFNFDGYTDVMMVSQDGIWGWAQVGWGWACGSWAWVCGSTQLH